MFMQKDSFLYYLGVMINVKYIKTMFSYMENIEVKMINF